MIAVTAKPHTRGTRPHYRRTFTGVLAAGILSCSFGCGRRTTDRSGDVVCDEREQRSLVANLGDCLILSAADLAVDQVAAVVVTAVLPGPRERHAVRVVAGAIEPGAVFVQPAFKAKAREHFLGRVISRQDKGAA